jgi:uncharacterized GH25 family protein
MFLRSAVIGLALFATTTAALAHDFWLQPTRWRVDPAAALDVTLLVGHGPYRQRSPIAASRIARFEAIAADGRRFDLRARMHLAAANGDATLGFARPGTYLLALETDNRAESHLPAIRFNDYLKVEGLTPALELRARTGRTDADGAENYSRHAKAIVRVGPADPRGQAIVTRPLGLTLEIVPERSPFATPAGTGFPVRVLYRGRPLAGALVKFTDLAHDAEPIEMHRSDAHGRAVFAMPRRGSWLINVIWTRPQPRTRLTDFDTDFSSLSFGLADP